jgi:hypothetical protein
MNNLSWSSGSIVGSNKNIESEQKEKTVQNYSKEIKDLKKLLDRIYEKYELNPTNYGSSAIVNIKSAIESLVKL